MEIKAVTGNLPFEEAFNRWISNLTIERAGIVTNARYLTDRGISDLKQYARAATRFFGKIPLEKIHAGHLMTYQQARAVCGTTVLTDSDENGEIKGWAAPAGANLVRKEVELVIRLMKAADCWNADLIKRAWRPLERVLNDVPRALTPREQQRWLEVAASRPEWQGIYWYTMVGLQTSCSSNELRSLRLGDIFLDRGLMEVRAGSAKNPYRKRTIPLQSEGLLWALSKLMEQARERGATEPFHYLFPFHVTFNRYDPRRPMTVSGIKKPWNAIRKATGFSWFRIYDLRHTAITRMAEAGMPIPVILSFAGHVSQQMQAHYTHVSVHAQRRWAASAFAGAAMPGMPGAAPMWQEAARPAMPPLQQPDNLAAQAPGAQRRLMG
jgi:integrase